MRQCSQNSFEVACLQWYSESFMILSRKEGSSLQICLGPHELVYYPAAVEKTLESTMYIKQVRITLLSQSGGIFGIS